MSLAAARALQLDLGRLTHPLFVLDGVTVSIGAEAGPARIDVARVSIGGQVWSGVFLECGRFHLAEGQMRCEQGRMSVPGVIERARIELGFDPGRMTGRMRVLTDAGEAISATLDSNGRLAADLSGLSLARAAAWWPRLAELGLAGRFDGVLEYGPGAAGLTLSGRVSDGAFASADGLQAAEALLLELTFGARPADRGWRWKGRLSWIGGAAYVHPLFVESGMQVVANGRLHMDDLIVERVDVNIDGLGSLAASGLFGLNPLRLDRAALTLADADLAVLGPRFLAPVVAPARQDSMYFSGRVSAEARIEADELVALDATLDAVLIGLDDPELGFGPLSGSVPWRAHAQTEAQVRVDGGHWKRLSLGAFDLDARLHGRSVELERVAIPLLDGRVLLEDVTLRREMTGWIGRGGLVVEPISMAQLTEAVGLPRMSGVLSASLPGLTIAPGELRLDGALAMSVFDGYLLVSRLQLLEPLGVAAHLYADVMARNLDLAQLTDTFAFGSVTGFIDADVSGLELVRWRPVRFEASVRSSPGRYARRISQRAVQNIGALGGAGAVAALQRGFLGLFDTFGYRELGLSCRLEGGVCMMQGLDEVRARDPDSGFVIVRGGGVPALNVIGYNRRVDWEELLARLKRAIESNVAPVIE
ncbi:hypothetical protein ACKVEX_06750 [Rhodocyclaceae bacterium SMB388]